MAFDLNQEQLYGSKKEERIASLSEDCRLYVPADLPTLDPNARELEEVDLTNPLVQENLLFHATLLDNLSLEDADRLQKCGLIDFNSISNIDDDAPFTAYGYEVHCTKYLSPRVIMQDIGGKMREIYKDVWLRICWLDALEALEQGKNVIVTDCRYGNEARLIQRARDLGYRNSIGIYLEREQAHSVAEHSSEQHEWLDEAGEAFIRVQNNGTGQEGLRELSDSLIDALETSLGVQIDRELPK